jgi:predicted nucleic-acid-binding protein
MVSLIDTNIITRFLAQNHPVMQTEAEEIFRKVQEDTLHIEILSEVLMEVLFVMTKVYKAPKNIVVDKLIKLLSLRGVVNRDKAVLITALEIMDIHRIDYVDALICAKKRLESYEWISFDHNLQKHCP